MPGWIWCPMPQGKLPPNTSAIFWGGAEINVVGSLVRGRVDVATISNLDMDDDEVVTGRLRDEIRVLHETRAVPRSVLLMRSSLPVPIRERAKDIMREMHLNEKGQSVLRKYFKVKKFEELDAAALGEFRWVRDAFNAHHSR